MFSFWFLLIVVCADAQLKTLSTNEIWSKSGTTYRRPAWSGNVTITYDDQQIWNVMGVLLPISTADRPSAPKPYNGFPTGTALSLDKGHVMALRYPKS